MTSLSEQHRSIIVAQLGKLRKFCFSLTGSDADADDLLQATVEKILDKGMPTDAHPIKWAYRVCKNTWIDEIRSREVRQRYPQQVDLESEVSLTTEAVASGERAIVDVSKALDQLPAEQRLALSLVAIDGKSYAEAADILEVPIGTIMSRIARARKNLVASLGDAVPDMTTRDKT